MELFEVYEIKMFNIKDDQEKPYMKRYIGYGIADKIHAY
jgi:hypothetical protein